MGDSGIVWCKSCGVHLALERESNICPVCRDEQRLMNERLYKELPT